MGTESPRSIRFAVIAVLAAGAAAFVYFKRSRPEPVVDVSSPTPWVDAGFPPFSSTLAETNRTYYKMVFEKDGFPATWNLKMSNITDPTAKGPVVNPILGTYVLADYLGQYDATSQKKYLDAAVKVGLAAVGRMKPKDGALVFMYEPPVAPAPYYSALTQVQYLTSLRKLVHRAPNTELSEAIEKVAASLAVPQERGGILFASDADRFLMELPPSEHTPPRFVLNGGLTTLRNLLDYWKACKCQTPEEKKLEKQLIRTITNLLPLYDSTPDHNIRYALSQNLDYRIRLDPPARITGLEVHSSGILPYRACSSATKSTRCAHVNRAPKAALHEGRVELALYPDVNRIRLAVESADAKKTRYSVELRSIEYHPVHHRKAGSWQMIAQGELAPGTSSVAISLSRAKLRKITALQTRFKVFGGSKPINVYHYISVNELYGLFRRSDDSRLRLYADKWLSFPQKWKSQSPYRETKVESRDYYSALGLSGGYSDIAKRKQLSPGRFAELAALNTQVSTHWPKTGGGMVPTEANRNLDTLLALPQANCAHQSYLLSRRAIERGYQTRRRGLFSNSRGNPNDLAVEIWVEGRWATFMPAIDAFYSTSVDRLLREPELAAAKFGNLERNAVYSTALFFRTIHRKNTINNENAYERNWLQDAATQCDCVNSTCRCKLTFPDATPVYRVWFGRLNGPADVAVRVIDGDSPKSVFQGRIPQDRPMATEYDVGFSPQKVRVLEVSHPEGTTFGVY